jgi:transmembrane sensor
MSTRFKEIPEPINEQAREWFMLQQTDDFSEADQRKLVLWCAEQPEHLQAFQQLEIIWQDLAELSRSPQGQELRLSVKANSLMAKVADVASAPVRLLGRIARGVGEHYAAVMLSVSVSVIAVLLLVLQLGEVVVDRYITGVGEIKSIVLADNTQVTLGAKSELVIRLTDSVRSAELLTGQVFFDVSKDPSKPFLVSVDDVLVRVVGTQFDVQKRLKSVSVAVLEGIVSVSGNSDERPGNTDAAIRLVAGQQVIKPRNLAFEPVSVVSEIELGAWRTGRLIYRNTSLEDVISDANRYFDGNISLLATELSQKKVTVTIRADQIAQLPNMLAKTLPLAARDMPGNNIMLSRRTASK